MDADRYFNVSATFVQLADSPNWSLTLHDYPEDTHFGDARWLGTGPIDRFTMHDILKVMDTRLETWLVANLGVQTKLDL